MPSTTTWLYLAHVATNRSDWEAVKRKTEERLRRVVRRTGEDHDATVFATWTRFREDVVTYFYHTSSPRIHEEYFSDLWGDLSYEEADDMDDARERAG